MDSNRGPMDTLRKATGSLRFKMTVGAITFIVMIAVVLSSLFVVYLERTEEESTQRLLVETTSAIAARTSARAGGDISLLGTQLDDILNDSRVLYVVIEIAEGRIARTAGPHHPELEPFVARDAAPGDRPRTRLLPNPKSQPRRLEVQVPLHDKDGNVIGTLRTAYSLTSASRRVEELRWRAFMITLLMIVMAASGTMFLIGRIIGPIQALAHGTERVSEGDFDFRIPEETDDEVGVLARSFNRMTDRLRESMDLQRRFSRDLAARVEQKTREIEETRQHLTNVVDNVGASILVADLDGTIISANMHTTHIFGSKPEFTVGRHLDELTCDPDVRTADLRERLEANGGPIVYDGQIRHGMGAMDLLITHTLLRDGHGQAAGFLQIAKDITELKRMERRLVSSERLSAMGEMAGEIGHELNNYLMAIGGRAELITNSLARGTDPRNLAKVERSATIIAEQVAEMRRLTDGLLDSARKETAPQAFDLNDLVRSSVEFVRPQKKFEDITFAVHLVEGGLPVIADPQQIRQIVLNLLSNGAEATMERTGSGGELRVRTFSNDRSVGFEISDDGVGIDEETRRRIFEPHFTTKSTGHGFGLAVCHRVVENHGGRIVVQATPGAGATFRVSLPLRAAGAPSEPAST